MRSEASLSVNAAFTKQSSHFDEDDVANPVIQHWRKRIYDHVQAKIKSNAKILELNAGTGIDANYFATCGYDVHATDLSDGMIARLKLRALSTPGKLTVQQVSFESLQDVPGKFDFVFSNFGGLNCSADLKLVTRHLPERLNAGAVIMWVIMPRVAPWEWLWLLRGKVRDAFRRLKKGGVPAHLEGEYFQTYYYSLTQIREALGPSFEFLDVEGLGVISPPPAALNIIRRFPRFTSWLNRVDQTVGKIFPFNRWGDHIIVSFRYRPI